MALHFELVSPEKLVFSGDVQQVDLPGAEGYFGVLENHAPTVATLRPGILTVHAAGGAQQLVVLGGFAEVSASGLTVLAAVQKNDGGGIGFERSADEQGFGAAVEIKLSPGARAGDRMGGKFGK